MHTQLAPAAVGVTLTRKAERHLSQLESSPTRSLSPRAARAIATLRRGVQDEIERLLVLLDRIDGDPDLEPDADGEPSLGFTSCGAGVRPWDAGDDDREADDSETEPSLGAPESVSTPLGPSYDDWALEGIRRTGEGRQTHWARGNAADLEGDATEDDEDGHDAEDCVGDRYGVADQDALDDPDCQFHTIGQWDGSGRRIALRLLHEAELTCESEIDA